MRRFVACLMVVLMVSVSLSPASAQSKRTRMNTRAGSGDAGPAPSFRGSERQGYEEESTPSYGVQPSMQSRERMSEEGGIQPMMLRYQVHVLGEVYRPGSYRIPASGRLSDAIKMAGLINENGSDRGIQIKRNGKVVQRVDLMQFMLYGDLANNPYLHDNDVVYVPLRDTVVQIVGAVKRPATYELLNERTLADVVKLGGGFNAATAKAGSIRVIRFEDGEKTVEEIPIEGGAMKRFEIENGDVIVVPNVVTKGTEFDYNVASIPGDKIFYPSYEDRVFVLGGVAMPGAYPFSPYYTVNQYISLAGGITEKGKEKYKIITPSGKERAANENDRVNPGDTIKIKERWMTPAGWLGFGLSIASFGLSASATVIAISK